MKVLHFNTNDKYKDFKQKFNAEKPDIVHIHDVWSFKVCVVTRTTADALARTAPLLHRETPYDNTLRQTTYPEC